MDKLLVCIIVILLIPSCKEANSPIKYSKIYLNDKLIEEGNYLNDTIKIGKHITYNSRGGKESVAIYNNDGQLDGKSVLFYESGQIHQERVFRNGLMHGPFIEYYRNGKRKTKAYYFDNRILGNVYHYTLDGFVEFNFYDLNGKNRIYLKIDSKGKKLSSLNEDDFLDDSIVIRKGSILPSDSIVLYVNIAKIPFSTAYANIYQLNSKGKSIADTIKIISDTLRVLILQLKDSTSVIRLEGIQKNILSDKQKIIISDYKIESN